MAKKTIVFDLDDTLVKEIDYLKSAYQEIASLVDGSNEELYKKLFNAYKEGNDVFSSLESEYNTYSKKELLSLYRNHIPKIELMAEAKEVLEYCKFNGYNLGLITDGRSITQRNKIKALGIESYFDLIVISEEFGSEKPCLDNFKAFEIFEGEKYYIGDNVKKDFIGPNKLGWRSVCLLDSGENIHKQSFEYPTENLPHFRIHSLKGIESII